LRRAGHTEASVDRAVLAGLRPAAAICEILKEDGTMARLPDLREFCAKHGLVMISIAELIQFRRQTEGLVRRVLETNLPTATGRWKLFLYDPDETMTACVRDGTPRPGRLSVHSDA
jgi:3,4-dihydroxy 2-butanone 4-phosphate synthase/GTP cyclohydrolase II